MEESIRCSSLKTGNIYKDRNEYNLPGAMPPRFGPPEEENKANIDNEVSGCFCLYLPYMQKKLLTKEYSDRLFDFKG